MTTITKHLLVLITATAIIFAMGLLMVFDTTAAEVLNRSLHFSTHHALIKQLLYAVLGTILGVGVWFLGYENVIKLSPLFLTIGIVLLISVFIPGIGQQLNGAHRWLSIGSFSFQPSEFVKFIIPIYFIHVITSRKHSLTGKAFLKLMGLLFVPIMLILIEPDNGTVVIIMSVLFLLFFLTQLRWIYWVLPLLLLCLIGGVVATQMSHVSDRIRVYLHPELDLRGKGHQPHQARIAAGSGGLFGKGIAQSMQKLDYLPEARSDYIAAIYAEEYGFVGIVVLVLLYMLLTYVGIYLGMLTHDIRAYYLITTLTFLISFQAFVNLGVVCGLLPSKGTNLPFFSQGGSSLLANFAALCLIINVAIKDNQTCKNNVL
jgi:cell division protein FtsW